MHFSLFNAFVLQSMYFPFNFLGQSWFQRRDAYDFMALSMVEPVNVNTLSTPHQGNTGIQQDQDVTYL